MRIQPWCDVISVIERAMYFWRRWTKALGIYCDMFWCSKADYFQRLWPLCLLGSVCFLLTSCQTAGTPAEKKERITKERITEEGQLSRSIENLPPDTIGRGEASITKNKSASSNIALVAATTKPSNPLDEDRAFQFLNQICALGPRITGSRPMQQQQKLLVDHFSGLGGK